MAAPEILSRPRLGADDLSGALTVGNVSLPVLLGCSLVGLAVVGGPFLDRVTPVLFWLWLVGVPLVGGSALVASRRAERRGRAILNAVLLSFWAVAAWAALLLH